MKNKQQIKEIKKDVEKYLKNPVKNKIKIVVPKDFKISYLCNPISVFFRKIALAILSKVPPMELKRHLFCLMGYDFRKDVCLPGYIDISPYFPKLIRLDKGILVGGMAKIYPITLEDSILTIGKIHLKDRVLISGMATIHPGAIVEKHTLIGMNAFVNTHIPKNSFVIKNNLVLTTWDTEQEEKYFGKSKNEKGFGRKVAKLTREFRKDKTMRKLEFKNNGPRLNAGCEWWRARPVTRIYYNGIFVELALLCNWEFGRKLLFWFMGQNLFGKNIKLGKRAMFDHIYGDMVSVGKNVVLGDDCMLDGHEYTIAETIFGRTIIEDNVILKKGVYIREGLTIGKGAIIEQGAFIMKNVGPGEIWKGAPAKLVGYVDKKKDAEFKQELAEKATKKH